MKSPREAKKQGFSPAMKILLAYCVFYVLVDLLLFVVLPLEGRMRPAWYALQMGTALCALAVELFLLRKNREDAASLGRGLAEMPMPELLILPLWFAWSCGACLLAVGAGMASLRQNVSYLFDMFMGTLVLFPLGAYLGRKRDLRLVNALIDTGAVIFLALTLAALMSKMTGRAPFMLLGHSYGNGRQDRLAVGTNPNVTGALCLFFLAAGIYRLHAIEKLPGRLCWCAVMGVNALALYLAYSRTCMAALAAALAVYAYALIFRRIQSRGGRILWGVLGISAAAAGCAGLVYLLSPVKGAARGGALFNLSGRLTIWTLVVKALKADDSLLLRGCSPASVLSFVGSLGKFPSQVNTHNQFLEILLGQGLPALVLFSCWLLAVILKGLRLLLRGGGAEWTLPLILLALTAGNMTEAMLVCQHQYTGCLFFLIAGYVSGLYRSEKSRT